MEKSKLKGFAIIQAGRDEAADQDSSGVGTEGKMKTVDAAKVEIGRSGDVFDIRGEGEGELSQMKLKLFYLRQG